VRVWIPFLAFVAFLFGVTVLIIIIVVAFLFGVTVLVIIIVVAFLFGVTVLVIVVVVAFLFGVTVLVIIIVVAFLFGVTVLVVFFFVVVHLGVAMMVFLAVDEFVGAGNCGCQLDELSPILQVGFSQPQRCLIQVHSVDKDQVGLRQFHGVGRSRLEGMGVGAGRHDGIEVDPTAADVVDNICKRQN